MIALGERIARRARGANAQASDQARATASSRLDQVLSSAPEPGEAGLIVTATEECTKTICIIAVTAAEANDRIESFGVALVGNHESSRGCLRPRALSAALSAQLGARGAGCFLWVAQRSWETLNLAQAASDAVLGHGGVSTYRASSGSGSDGCCE